MRLLGFIEFFKQKSSKSLEAVGLLPLLDGDEAEIINHYKMVMFIKDQANPVSCHFRKCDGLNKFEVFDSIGSGTDLVAYPNENFENLFDKSTQSASDSNVQTFNQQPSFLMLSFKNSFALSSFLIALTTAITLLLVAADCLLLGGTHSFVSLFWSALNSSLFDAAIKTIVLVSVAVGLFFASQGCDLGKTPLPLFFPSLLSNNHKQADSSNEKVVETKEPEGLLFN